MSVYKNILGSTQKFRADGNVYECAPGKTIEVPVEIDNPAMELVDKSKKSPNKENKESD